MTVYIRNFKTRRNITFAHAPPIVLVISPWTKTTGIQTVRYAPLTRRTCRLSRANNDPAAGVYFVIVFASPRPLPYAG